MTTRRNSIRRTVTVWGLVMGALAVVLASYAVPAIPPLQHLATPGVEGGKAAGHSLHAKNRATPDWILELQTRNARQPPVTVQSDEPSFWI